MFPPKRVITEDILTHIKKNVKFSIPHSFEYCINIIYGQTAKVEIPCLIQGEHLEVRNI